MDPEQRERKQNLRVIISEIVMVATVVLTVIILALIVSGYWLNSDFEVERQGMLQVSSTPSGASVEVDGDAPWFQRTNTSKILSSGEHIVTLAKDNYDTWTKTVNINEGLLYKLNYPRLFLKDRVKEIVKDIATTTFASVSPDRKLLLATNNTTSWKLFNLDNDNVRSSDLDVAPLFFTNTQVGEIETLDYEIISANWDEANEHILMEINGPSSHQWVLLNVKNPTKSINLTREFVQDFRSISIFNQSASILLAVVGDNLHRIDLESMQISSVIIPSVEYYDIFDSEIIFSNGKQIGIIKNFSTEVEYIQEIKSPTMVLFGKFYDNRYIFTIDKNYLAIYKKDDDAEAFETEISFVPSTAKIGPGAEFIFMSDGNNHFATFDMESMQLTEWSVDSSHFGWLNGHMLYSVKDGMLSVYDYDGLNHRILSSNVSERFPVTITNDKWLYYVSDGNLAREWLIPK